MTGIRPAFVIITLVMALIVMTPISVAATSHVHGYVYEWSMLGLVTNATVQIDSATGTRQQMVTTSGFYSFNLSPGNYVLIAQSGSGQDTLYAKENITVTQEGDIVLDLILFPVSDLTDLEELDQDVEIKVPEETVDYTVLAIVGGVIAIVALGAGAAAIYFLTRKKPEQVEPTHLEDIAELEPDILPQASPSALTEDLKQVIAIIEKSGGRITQLDLRKALPYSEAKVSLMITDLESRGILRKVKKGRGNVIILNKDEDLE